MPIVTIIGLVFTGIKLAMAINAYLKEHPDEVHKAVGIVNDLKAAMEKAANEIQPPRPQERVESP